MIKRPETCKHICRIHNTCSYMFKWLRNEAYNFFSSSPYEGKIGRTTSSLRDAL
jgi:hypothetical protein